MNAKKILTIVTWTLLVKTQMDPLCAPVYLDLTEMDETAQVKAFRLLFPRYDLTCLFVFVFLIVCLICTFLLCFFCLFW